MFQVPKELEGHYVSILLPGIPTIEMKVIMADQEEVIGRYANGDEVRIRQRAINAYWPDMAKAEKVKAKKKAMEKVRAAKKKKALLEPAVV